MAIWGLLSCAMLAVAWGIVCLLANEMSDADTDYGWTEALRAFAIAVMFIVVAMAWYFSA